MLPVAGPALRAGLLALGLTLVGGAAAAAAPAQAVVAPKVRAYDVKVRASFDLVWTRGAVGQPCTSWTYETGSTNAKWRNHSKRGTRVYILSFPGKAIEFRGAVQSSGDASRKWTQRIETTSSPGCPTACTPLASSSGPPVAHAADPIGPCTSSPQSEPEQPKTDCGKRSVTKSWAEFKVEAFKQPDGRSVQQLKVSPPADLLGWARCPTASKPTFFGAVKPGAAAVSIEELLLLKRGKRLRFEGSRRQQPCTAPAAGGGSCTYDWDLTVTVTRRAGRPGTR